MLAAVAALSPDEAKALLDNALAFEEWVRELRVHPNELVTSLTSRAADWVPPPPPPHVDLRRPDAAPLRDFVKRAVHLPLRMKQVAVLCLEQGLTLDECAARLGIARATVRVHLRRLRERQRECAERERLRR